MPSTKRIPKQIPPSAFDPMQEGRIDRLLSQHEYNYVRKLQLAHRLKTAQPLVTLLRASEHPDLNHDVVCGQQGETIALYSDTTLGRGSFGTVYFGVNCDTGEFQAIKRMRISESLGCGPEEIVHELRILSKLDKLSDCLYINDRDRPEYAAALPFHYGDTLFNAIFSVQEGLVQDKIAMTLIEKLEMALSVVKELQSFHDKKLLHCDFKLNNIMWDPLLKKATLIDFGTTLSMNKHKSAKSFLAGTELYIAPEYLRDYKDDKTTYTVSGEIYALGVSLLQIFSNEVNTQHPRKQTIFYAANTDENGLSPFFEKMAPDIFKKHESSSMRSISSLLRSLLDIDPNNRKSLESIEKTISKVLSKELKKEKKAKASNPTTGRCTILKQQNYCPFFDNMFDETPPQSQPKPNPDSSKKLLSRRKMYIRDSLG